MAVGLTYNDAFELLDRLAEELGQQVVSPEAYVFTPDWSEGTTPPAEVIDLEAYRAAEGLPPEDAAYDCDGRCINCKCGYYRPPKSKVFEMDLRPDNVRLRDAWTGDGFGPHKGNDVY